MASSETSAPPPDITVVIPTRNRLVLLRRLLDRLTAIDDGLRYQIVVVDEASSDDTPAWLATRRDDLDAVGGSVRLDIVRHDVPRGPSGARNAGLARAEAPLVAFIDDDDLTAPDRLRRQRDAIVSGGTKWSCAGKVDIDDDLTVIGHGVCPPLDSFLDRLLASNVLPAAGQGLLVETDLARQVGGFDVAIHQAEDWDLCIRLAISGPPAMVDEPLVGYRTGVASLSTDTSKMEAGIRAVLAKHAPLRAERGVSPAWFEIHRSLLAADLLTSRRRSARRAWAILRARPTAKEIVRFTVTVTMPHRMATTQARRRREQVPEAWRRQADAWLRSAPAS